MMPTRQGSFRLFRFAGVDVYLHWLWFLLAAYQISNRNGFFLGHYSSTVWKMLEFLALFGIVLTHEFGHALACRSVGGQANQIVLWLLGGVAYVSPPQRPGAMLWSIAAGPLVNVVLAPVFTVLVLASRSMGWSEAAPDAYFFLENLWCINVLLLCFNLLPIYPLDGGQIFRSLLWFVFGRATSLMIASIAGFIGVAATIGLALLTQSVWYGILSVFILLNCWGGLMQARVLARIAKLPRRAGFACPECKTSPPIGDYWVCGKCRQAFDTFVTQGTCPHCGTQFSTTRCLDCGSSRPMNEWMAPPPFPPNT
jgi:Zn-dependent protease